MLRLALVSLASVAPTLVRAQEAGPVPTSDHLLRVTLGLVLVLALVALLAWALRRFARLGLGGGNLVRVLAAVPVGTRERVVLVQVGSQQLLVGVAPGSVRTLLVLDTPLASDATGRPADDAFARRLRQAMGRSGDSDGAAP